MNGRNMSVNKYCLVHQNYFASYQADSESENVKVIKNQINKKSIKKFHREPLFLNLS